MLSIRRTIIFIFTFFLYFTVHSQSKAKVALDKSARRVDSLSKVISAKNLQLEKLTTENKRLQANLYSLKEQSVNKKDNSIELEDKLAKQQLEIKKQKADLDALHLRIKQLESQLNVAVKSNAAGEAITSTSKAGVANTPPAIHTVKIGSQYWMTSNLNVVKFRNGDPIKQAQTEDEWELAGKKKVPAWCYYDNDPKNNNKSGKLYNWYAVNDPRGIAPEGFHVPNEEDWNQLINQLGGEEVAAPKMRFGREWGDSITVSHAKASFAAVPTGWRKVAEDGTAFTSEGAYWWCATPLSLKFAWTRYVLFFSKEVKSYCYNKASGLAVRCVKD
jgi:uncharacterized protein (TIGR02145 family)